MMTLLYLHKLKTKNKENWHLKNQKGQSNPNINQVDNYTVHLKQQTLGIECKVNIKCKEFPAKHSPLILKLENQSTRAYKKRKEIVHLENQVRSQSKDIILHNIASMSHNIVSMSRHLFKNIAPKGPQIKRIKITAIVYRRSTNGMEI